MEWGCWWLTRMDREGFGCETVERKNHGAEGSRGNDPW